MKYFILLCTILAFLLLIGSCMTTKTASTEPKTGLSESLDDYITYEGQSGYITYKLATFESIEQWFVDQAKGKSDKEIESLYDQLPLIGDLDNFDDDPPELKTKRVLKIARTILDNGENYTKTKKAFTNVAIPALDQTFQFYSRLYPDLEMNIIFVLNPFFCNGGMGLVSSIPGKGKLGRLEIGVAVMSDSSVGDEIHKIFIAHEFTHIVHQYLGGSGFEDLDEDSPLITEDTPLFTEGVASYYSSLIGETEKMSKIIFYDAYNADQVENDKFIQNVAARYLEEMAGKQFSEKHRGWFSGNSTPDERPFAPYPAIGYYLGYHVVKDIIDSGRFTLKSLLEQPIVPEMQDEVRKVVENLAKG